VEREIKECYFPVETQLHMARPWVEGREESQVCSGITDYNRFHECTHRCGDVRQE
jgi:hypothetical protein